MTALCPGFVDTNLFATAPLGIEREVRKKPPRWLLTTPEKIALRGIKAIRRNEGQVVMQPYAKLAHLGKRLVPRLIDWANCLSRKRARSPSGDASGTIAEHRRAA